MQAVVGVTAASLSPRPCPSRSHSCASSPVNSSRPVVFGGALAKYGWASIVPSSSASGSLWAARAPSVSYCCEPLVRVSTAASSSALPGPVSNASTVASLPSGGTKVTLAKPPMFCTALQPPARARNSASTTLVTGAPCPPKAMSAVRKSAATVRPVRCAMTAASPI